MSLKHLLQLLLFLVVSLIAFIIPNPTVAQPSPPRLGDGIVVNRPLTEWDRIPMVSGFVARTKVSNPGSGGFRLFFDHIKKGTAPFEFRLIGSNGVIDSFDELTFATGETFTTPLIMDSELTLEIKAAYKPDGLEFRLWDLQFEVQGGQPFATVGNLDWQLTATLTNTDVRREIGRAVAKIVFRNENGFDVPCTGFMFAPDLLLTNRHCLGTQARCSSATVIFGFLSLGTIGEQVRCQKLIQVDEDRDMAVVRLVRPLGSTWGMLTLAQEGPKPGQELYVLQHPGGGPQRISTAGCKGSKVDLHGPYAGVTFSHLCDTQGGSSGSPVLDAQTHQVVGLHYCCFPLPLDGENRGIPIDRIHEKLPKP